jgi:hypothetical protein
MSTEHIKIDHNDDCNLSIFDGFLTLFRQESSKTLANWGAPASFWSQYAQ